MHDHPGSFRAGSPRFVELWNAGTVGERRASRKTVRHPTVGSITLDCDMLHIPDTDQSLIVYSAGPDTAEAEALALVRTIGLQDMRSTTV